MVVETGDDQDVVPLSFLSFSQYSEAKGKIVVTKVPGSNDNVPDAAKRIATQNVLRRVNGQVLEKLNYCQIVDVITKVLLEACWAKPARFTMERHDYEIAKEQIVPYATQQEKVQSEKQMEYEVKQSLETKEHRCRKASTLLGVQRNSESYLMKMLNDQLAELSKQLVSEGWQAYEYNTTVWYFDAVKRDIQAEHPTSKATNASIQIGVMMANNAATKLQRTYRAYNLRCTQKTKEAQYNCIIQPAMNIVIQRITMQILNSAIEDYFNFSNKNPNEWIEPQLTINASTRTTIFSDQVVKGFSTSKAKRKPKSMRVPYNRREVERILFAKCIRIQSCFRGYLVRKLICIPKSHVGRKAKWQDVATMQRHWRRAQKTNSLLENQLNDSATEIQNLQVKAANTLKYTYSSEIIQRDTTILKLQNQICQLQDALEKHQHNDFTELSNMGKFAASESGVKSLPALDTLRTHLKKTHSPVINSQTRKQPKSVWRPPSSNDKINDTSSSKSNSNWLDHMINEKQSTQPIKPLHFLSRQK